MSLLSSPLPPTLAQNPSHPFSYHHLLPLTSLATLTAIIHPGTPTHRKTNQAKICLIGSSLLIFYLYNPEHHTLLHRATGNISSPDLSLVPARINSKCTWQTLPDLGSDNLPISITIPISPLINSFHRPPSFNYNKSRWDDYLTYIDTHCPTPSNFTTLSLSEATHTFTKLLNDAATSAIPFGSITALLKHGGLLKSQMPLQNAERHLQRHTVPKKTASTISPLADIPPL